MTNKVEYIYISGKNKKFSEYRAGTNDQDHS